MKPVTREILRESEPPFVLCPECASPAVRVSLSFQSGDGDLPGVGFACTACEWEGNSVRRNSTLGTPLRLSEDTVPEMIRNRNGSPVAKAVSVEVALTLIEYANERDALRGYIEEIKKLASDPFASDAVALRACLLAANEALGLPGPEPSPERDIARAIIKGTL